MHAKKNAAVESVANAKTIGINAAAELDLAATNSETWNWLRLISVVLDDRLVFDRHVYVDRKKCSNEESRDDYEMGGKHLTP